MSQPRGRCAFCGSDQVRLSKGHIWPECFGEILPSDAKYHEQKIGYFNTFETQIPGPEKFERVGTGPLQKRRPRNTCVKCNGGWMSLMERASLPVVKPLILATPSLLDTKGMNLLAPVLALVSMRIELTAKAMRATPQHEVRSLMETGRPSSNWRIWIARYTGSDLKDYSHRYTAMQLESKPTAVFGPEHCNTQVTTLVAGQLYAHLMFSSVWPNFGGYEGIALTQIWPASELHIRTEFLPTISEGEGVSLHEAISRAGKAGQI
jgi:hypothetical protein